MSRRVYLGDTIITLKDLKVQTNRMHTIPARSRMKVVGASYGNGIDGCVEAVIERYVNPNSIYYNSLFQTSSHTATEPIGVMFNVNPKDFLVVYNVNRDEHYDFEVRGIKDLNELPYQLNEALFEKKFNHYRINLSDLIYYIDDAFAQEVEQNVTWRDLSEDEIESGEG